MPRARKFTKTKVCTDCQVRKFQKDFHYSCKAVTGRREKCKTCTRRNHRVKYHGMTQEQKRGLHLKKVYGLSVEVFDSLWNYQDGKCAICKRPQADLRRALCIDHNHLTNEVNGLLCARCNSCLGWFGDSIDGLMAVVEYLKSPPARVIIGVSNEAIPTVDPSKASRRKFTLSKANSSLCP